MRVLSSLLGALPLIAIVAAPSCSRPSPPTIHPVSGKITGLALNGVDMVITLDAFNPNAKDLAARSVTASITMGGDLPFGKTTVANAVALPAGKTTRLDLPVSAPWTGVANMTTLLARPTAALPYTVEGTVNLGGDVLNIDVPFHMDGTMTKDELIAATLHSMPAIPGLPTFALPPR